jgi:hypothetical protein
MRMIVPYARPEIPYVYGFHVTTLCSHVVATGNTLICSFWMTLLINDYVHILSEAYKCDILGFAVEAVVLYVIVTYSLETCRPY